MKNLNFKRILSLLLTMCLVFSLMPAGALAATEATAETDIGGHWAAAAIETCHTYGIMNGDGNGNFNPYADTTRAEFATMVNRAFGYGVLNVPGVTGYKDLPSNKWYTKDMKTAIALGFINGYGEGIAAPEDKITREQAAVILYKILRLTASEAAATKFADFGEVSSWAKDAVLAMEQSGYVAGYNNQFMPKKHITRGESAQLLLNVFGDIVDGNFDAKGKQYKNVTIRKPGVVLKNAVIKGDLFITEGVGDGDVWLDAVKISGRLIAAGGGGNSIHVKDITVGDNVVVDKPSVAGNEPVRFRAIQTNDSTVIFQGTAREVIVTEDIIIIIDMDGEKTVFNMFKPENSTAKPSIMIAGDAVVEKVTAFVPADIKGGGEVGKVEAHTNGVTVDAGLKVDPGKVEAENGIEVRVGGETVTGTGITQPTTKPSDPPAPLTAPSPSPTPAPTTPPSGGGNSGGGNDGGNSGGNTGGNTGGNGNGGGSTTVSVTGVTLNKTVATLAVGGTETLTATVSPANATNKNVTWESSDTGVATVSGGVVTAVSVGSATITVKTNDGNKTAACAVTVEAVPDGTAGNPFLVTSEADLRGVGTNTGAYVGWTLSAHYKQTANIALTAAGGGGSIDWTAIGKSTTPFTGRYDGGGKTITGLTINASATYQGLFGSISGGSMVKNVGLVDVNISGGSAVGGVIGYNSGTVQNCFVTGAITGSSGNAGGVVGTNNGTLQNCYFTGSVTNSSGTTGGVAGSNYDTVQNCYAIGTVASGATNNSNYAGGVVGINGSTGKVQNCVALNQNVTIAYTADTTTVGRVVGGGSGTNMSGNYAWSGMKLYASWNGSTGVMYTPTSSATGKDGADLTAVAAKTQGAWGNASGSTGANFTFDADNWKWDASNNYMPNLFGEQIAWPGHLVDPGTAGNPLLVKNVTELGYVGKGAANPEGYKDWTLSAHYKQTADIDMGGQSFTSIGTFTGGYDGGGHTISNLTVGMFNQINATGMVKNVELNGAVSGTGSIAMFNFGLIDNCGFAGTVTGTSNIGSIVSSNYNGGVIRNCRVTGNVTSTGTGSTVQNIGGIAGENAGATIENCFVSGNITINGGRTTKIGGIVGQNYHNNGLNATVRNCYFTGTISGGYYIGGISGTNSNSTIENCYVTGKVSGASSNGSCDYVGGIVGSIGGSNLSAGGTVKNCVALNAEVTATSSTTSKSTYLGRVMGGKLGGDVILENNYAHNAMTVTNTYSGGNEPFVPTDDVTGKDGADLTVTDAKTQAAWITAGFTFTPTQDAVWTWDADGDYMPSLHGEQIAWPVYLDDLGDGSQSDPFKVYDAATLKRVGTDAGVWSTGKWTLDAHYTQIADIDMDGQSFTAIGNDSKQFTGTYNGGNFTITDLTIVSTDDYQGLFGYNTGTIQNVGLDGGSVTGGDFVGGIMGYNIGTVENCSSSAAVTGENYVGGVVGRNNGGTVAECYSTGTVTAEETTTLFAMAVPAAFSAADIPAGYIIEMFDGTDYVFVERIAFDKDPSDASVTLPEFTGNTVALRIRKDGGGLGFMDYIAVDGAAATVGGYIGKKLAAADLDVLEIKADGLELTFTGVTDGIVTLRALIEPEVILGSPFYLDADVSDEQPRKTYAQYNLDNIGSITIDGVPDTLDIADAFRTYNTFPISGHPAGNAWIWVFNDGENLYVVTEWSTDNTFDYGADFFKVYVDTGVEIKTYTQWSDKGEYGMPAYAYTGLLPYEHMCYELAIPLSELDGAETVTLGFALYGTAVDASSHVGGVVGHNSGAIANCYATGTVTNSISDGAAGGIVGSVYSGGSVTNCYATGDVVGTYLTGGVAGFISNGTVKNCVALNPELLNNNNYFLGRVWGFSYGTPTNNYARSDMTLNNGAVTPSSAPDSKDGADITATQYHEADWWTNAGNWDTAAWDTAIWDIQDGSLPTLNGFSGTQTPVAPTSFALPLSFNLAAVTVTTSGSALVVVTGTEDGYTFVGETVTVTATPDEGWTFSHWQDEYGEIVSSDTAYTFEVTGDITLTAVCVEDTALPIDDELENTPTDDPRKEPEYPEVPEDNDEETPDPDDDGDADDDSQADGSNGDGDTQTQMTPQQAIQTLNNLLAYCGTVTRG